MRLAAPELTADLRRGAFAAVLSGALAALVFAPFDCWFLAPVALVPLLVVLRRTATLRGAAYLALLCGWTLCLVSLHWLWSIFATGAIGVCVLVALPWALFGLAYRALCPRFSPLALVALTPALYTAMEWVRCEGWYFRFSWLQLGTAYVAAQAAQSTYPLVGVYGMTFLSVLVSAALAAVWTQPTRPARLRALIGAAALVALLAGGFRAAWLAGLSGHGAADAGQSVRALLVQSETEDLDWFVGVTREYARAQPDLIVWPELAVNEYLEDNPETLAKVAGVAKDAGATLVLGCKSHAPADARCDWLRRRAMRQAEGDVYYNTAAVLDPAGRIIGRYHKYHPIQFFADGVPGGEYGVYPTPVGRLGVAICYDFDFAATALNLAWRGAELIVVPTYDARNWGRSQQVQHARLALARAAEVGRYVVRPTSSGVSQIIAPGGEQITWLPRGDASHILGLVETRRHLTPYVRGAWALPHLCLLVSALALLAALRRRRA